MLCNDDVKVSACNDDVLEVLGCDSSTRHQHPTDSEASAVTADQPFCMAENERMTPETRAHA
jgi:hypothetical protein